MKAIWNEIIVAESDDTVVVDGNHYFPRESLSDEFIEKSSTTSVCSWKGTANYFTLKVNGKTNPDAVWYYPEPKEEAQQIAGRIAFWKGVQIVE
ncbi:DUF427 domain-containing protein [Thalassoglobus polymorphus]|uniref:DUF427 domain-containing protein n=1 Tax=Thalassoglobus polymorphus TaxID=2527994 RepID=A0A517QKI0_9PLAN|nr:DUF427 domain-containing protein [Thalassoglobus polymorphus]QDT32146.1 hypothetical protein Mal48_13880 [Thalassoglobus polymorphus]